MTKGEWFIVRLQNCTGLLNLVENERLLTDDCACAVGGTYICVYSCMSSDHNHLQDFAHLGFLLLSRVI